MTDAQANEQTHSPCIHNLLAAHAEREPHALCIHAPGRVPLTYGRLFDLITESAGRLRSFGVNRNDRIAIVLPNGPEMAAAFLAVASCATSAPLNPSYRAGEFDFYLSDLNAKALLIQKGFDSPARDAAGQRGIRIIELSPISDGGAGSFSLEGPARSSAADVDFAGPEDVALILHTSGTTSRPKMVPLTNLNVCASAHNIAATLHLGGGDICLNIMPLFHIHGLIAAVLATMAAGASVACTPGFFAPKFFEWMNMFRPTWYSAVPTMHQAILARAAQNGEIIRNCPLRFLRSSSASLPPQVMAELESVFGAPVIEAYGMTEASHQMASNPLPPRKRKPGSVGPAAGPEVAIMDEAGAILPARSVGEIVIRGTNVTRGYENNPNANNGAFTQGWFRTGDQGYLDEDGYLFITGRLKEIINRGGEKISPREVDEVLMDHPDIEQVVTFALPDPRLGEDVAAAVVLKKGASVDPKGIRHFAAARLADFKVPRRIVVLEEIPKGPTGKLQRVGLAERLGLTANDEEAAAAGAVYAAPRDPTEERLASIWGEVLGLPRVGIHDEFLYLGGDSMLATLLISRVREAFQVNLSLLTFFEEASTVERMAQWLLEAPTQEAAPAVALQPVARHKELPLSFAQERQWFIQQVDPHNCAYNCTVCFRFTGALDTAALRQALREIIRRHEALRTRVAMVDGHPMQSVEEAGPLDVKLVDLCDHPEADRQAAAMRHMVEEARRPFDLSKDVLLRAVLLELSENEHFLLNIIHHIAFDGWSVGVFAGDFLSLYSAFSRDESSPLAGLPIQYADFASWQRECMNRGIYRGQIDYWRGKLSGDLPVLLLPTDYRRPSRQSYRGSCLHFALDEELSRSLREVSKSEGATLFMVLLASFQCLLHRYSGQSDIIIGCPISGRIDVQTENLIGMFINTLPLRTDFSGDPLFRDLLLDVRKTALEAYENQHLPFQKIVEIVKPQRNPGSLPLFQAMFVLENAPMPQLRLPHLKVDLVDIDKKTSIADVSLQVWDKTGGISGWFEYDAELFHESTIERMANHFQMLLRDIVKSRDRRISELQLVPESERNQLLFEWNQTATVYPRDCSLPELFQAQAERTPDALAVAYEGRKLTYRQLNERSNMLAHFLRSCGVETKTIVGVCMDRSVDMVVAFLGILKAAAAYLPLDPAYPAERLEMMLNDSGARVLLTQKPLADALSRAERRVVCLDSDWHAIERENSQNPAGGATADDVAYVIYTSGSTGKPKGVCVPHRAIARLVLGTDYIQLMPSDKVAQVSNCSFDAATFEIWGALLNGAQLIGLAREATLSPKTFAAQLEQYGITTLFLTTALFNHMARESPRAFKRVKHLLFGGETVDPRWVREILEHSPPERLLHVYGPTENTTFSTWYLIEHLSESAKTVPIGRPIANTVGYVLDSRLQPAPVGVPGELYLGGDGLAHGYLNHPELTREKFVPHPFPDESGTHLYRTGDLVRYLPDGNIEFIGRIDNQVKIRGFRIEPEEVEVLLGDSPAVRESLVLVREDEPGNRQLVAYVTPEQGHLPTASDLRDFLKKKAPDYMIPSAFVVLDAFPLTPNGKIDRKALPVPHRIQSLSEPSFEAPNDSLELQVVKLWEDLLNVRPIGINDNFFELGGHSLLVARLFSHLEKMTGKVFSLSTLIENPTVRQLAVLLRDRGWSPQWRSLVPIQPYGTKRPLFCVHPVSGNILGFRELARCLGDEQPLYGLQALGLDGKCPPLTTVEQMAAHYLMEIRSVFPDGPYLLAGRCSIGGLVAFEMAQLLQRQGQKVTLLAMIDVPNAQSLRFPEKDPNRHKSFLRYPRRNLVRVISGLFADAQARRFRRVHEANIHARNNYLPKVYPGRITYFLCEKYHRRHWTRFRHTVPGGWQDLAEGGVDLHVVPGDHQTMLDTPHVEVLAEKMKMCIEKTIGTESSTAANLAIDPAGFPRDRC